MPTREQLIQAINDAEAALNAAKGALDDFDSRAENNVFADLETAEDEMTDKLVGMASDDCEGAGSVGCDEYTAEFTVDGVVYIGTLTVEYNRHDKTYYYVDEYEFTYKVKE
jgi:hypothetical protein